MIETVTSVNVFQDNERLKQAFEEGVSSASFSMTSLVRGIDALNFGPVTKHRSFLEQTLGTRIARYVYRGLLRTSFLIETVLTRGGATKISVRWTPLLVQDIRYATFEECYRTFEKLLTQLSIALADERHQLLLSGFAAQKLVSYELPVDYREKRIDRSIHEVDNLEWDWSPLPSQIIRLRRLLRTVAINPYADVFITAYSKIGVKTYLTDRAQTGDYQTNREKRWESHPKGFQFALRRDCWGVEVALMNQICHFAGFPTDLFQQLELEGALIPIATPYRCPITLEPMSFEDFQTEIMAPEHGKARFQVGHLNPLRASGQTTSGHTATNIGWITADGNRIQGHLTLNETRALLQRIAANYQDSGLAQG